MHVKAYIGSQIAHVSQIFTGLAILQQSGKITLSFAKDPELSHRTSIQRIEAEGRMLVFDLADGFGIDPKWYSATDRYFKRMLSPKTPDPDNKIRPYGLNYPVSVVGDGFLYRTWLSGDRRLWLKSIARRSLWLSRLFRINLAYATSQVHHFEGAPGINAQPRLIYYTRLWDPDRVKDEAMRAQREAMNALRRDLVLALRLEFGDRFTGGIYRTDFAAAYAPEAAVPDNRVLHKAVYLRNLRASDIGIADYGLEMSVGFKLAEYVAMSKAIVTTPINTVLPGAFEEGRNYLAYKNVEQCLTQCETLLCDPQRLLTMQYQNAAYYRDFLRPDRLVWNCLNAD